MKIIKPGALEKDGIYVICEHCYAEFVAEDRNDITRNTIYYWDFENMCNAQTIEYSILCPCCGNEYYLGVDPKDNKNFCNNRAEFSREDWNTRYK